MKSKFIICTLCLLTLSACTKKQDEPKGCGDELVCEVGQPADMSAYEGFMNENHQFKEALMNDFLIKLNSGADAIFYIGYSTCPWCVEALPIMNEVAQELNLTIYYIDKKAETSDPDTIRAVEEVLGDRLDQDEDGKPHLYVPYVVVMQDGEIRADHTGTLADHDAHERKMSEAEQAELKQIYTEMFQILTSENNNG